MGELNCPVSDCEFSTKTNRGLSIHASSKHPDLEYDFTNRETDTCDYCGDKYKYYPSRRNREGRKNFFCNKECADKFKAKDGLDTHCTECNKDIHIPPSHIKEVGGYKQKNYFCGKDCESKFKKREWTGEEHPSYNGGTIKQMGENWREKREKVIKRDNNTCQNCGIEREKHKDKYNKGLHVHHKVPRSQILSDEPTKSEIELANNMANLVTLCASCHRKLE